MEEEVISSIDELSNILRTLNNNLVRLAAA